MTVFVIGCTHFGHGGVNALAHRPFASFEEADETMIERWNKTVGKNDTVYHLGDFAYRSVKAPEDYIKRLRGLHVFLQGNHDPRGWGPDLSEINVAGKRIVLCHYPFEEWNGAYRGTVHFHAHTHSKDLISGPARAHVGADATDFTPIAVETVLAEIAKGGSYA